MSDLPMSPMFEKLYAANRRMQEMIRYAQGAIDEAMAVQERVLNEQCAQSMELKEKA